MGFFGFIENFFFISLALVFALVLLLVYHFKNRIAVAEKKSESMYGLLTAVVKEIKSLRGMFGLGSSDPTPSEPEPEPLPLQVEVKSKLTPEVTVETTAPKSEVITLDFSASDNKKIVVSDDDSDEDSDEEDDESSIESSDDDNDDNELQVETINISGVIQVNTDDIPTIDDVHVVELTQKLDGLEESQVNLELVEKVETSLVEDTPVDETVKDSSPPSIDQLRKMNINQLKTLASQLGIVADINKMKKPELITTIQSLN
jgi:hypothetical protein